MPIYSYECNLCKYKFDELQKVDDKPLKTCPSCKETALRKVIALPHVVFKGNGWTPKHY
jgi:putative FmdB family regulatory protein